MECGVVHTDPDVSFGHLIQKLVPAYPQFISVQEYGVQVMSVSRVFFLRCREKKCQILKCFIVLIPYLFSSFAVSINTFELMHAPRCLGIHHVVFKTGIEYLVMFVS